MTTGSRVTGSYLLPLYYKKTWSGGNSPHDHTQMNAYNCIIESIRQVPCSYQSVWPDPPGPVYVYNNNPPIYQETAFDTNIDLKALSRIRNAIAGHDFHAGIFIAEGKEAVELIVGCVRACINALYAIRRLDLPSLLRTMPRLISGTRTQLGKVEKALRGRSIADLWLAIQYGWRPLIQDLGDACNAYDAFKADRPTTRYRATVSAPAQVINTGTAGPHSQLCNYYDTVSYTVLLRQRYSFMGTLGFTDITSVIWEKIPFSFVADWFIPIGSYLRERAYFASTDLTYCRTQFTITEVNCPTWLTSGTPPRVQGSYKGHFIRIKRTTGADLSVPMPSMKSMERAFGKEHLQNAAALIYGLVDDYKRRR